MIRSGAMYFVDFAGSGCAATRMFLYCVSTSRPVWHLRATLHETQPAEWPAMLHFLVAMLLIIALSINAHGEPRSATLAAAASTGESKPTGLQSGAPLIATGQFGVVTVEERTATIIIPRRRSGVGVPPPFLASASSIPAGILRGRDMFGTVYRFAPIVKGQLIETEGFGEATVGAWWNNGNTLGDMKLRTYLVGSASDFSVDGQADLHSQPYLRNREAPDLHGPDCLVRANGLASQGSGFRGERLRFFQIPGTAVVLLSGAGPQAGQFGIYDHATTQLSDISILQCINGIDCRVNDSRLSKIAIAGVAKDGLRISGPGTYLDDCHVWGADRAAVFETTAQATNCYFEAARIGTHILPTGASTRINGLHIGPGTCSYRGVLIEANSCEIVGLWGTVRSAIAGAPDIAGLEIKPGLTNIVIQGKLAVGDQSTGVILRGHRNVVRLVGGWSKSNPTLVRVVEPVTGCTLDITGGGSGGTVLDLSASGLDKKNGLGNDFNLKWGGAATRVIYPGGGTKFNLATGTQLTVDGVLQH